MNKGVVTALRLFPYQELIEGLRNWNRKWIINGIYKFPEIDDIKYALNQAIIMRCLYNSQTNNGKIQKIIERKIKRLKWRNNGWERFGIRIGKPGTKIIHQTIPGGNSGQPFEEETITIKTKYYIFISYFFGRGSECLKNSYQKCTKTIKFRVMQNGTIRHF